MKHKFTKEEIKLHQFSKEYLISENDELGKKYKKRDETLNFDEIKFPKVLKVIFIFLIS